MEIVNVYSIDSEDMEKTKDLLESLLGLKAIGRENDARGGDYYSFEGEAGENFRLMNNFDIFDEEPLYEEAGGSKFVLYAFSPVANSELLAAIERMPATFVKVISKSFVGPPTTQTSH